MKKKTVGLTGRPLTKREIGCSLSHRNAYMRILDEDVDLAYVLADAGKFYYDWLGSAHHQNELPGRLAGLMEQIVVPVDHYTGSRRVAESVGVYDIVKAVRNKISNVIVRLKPIRFYR